MFVNRSGRKVSVYLADVFQRRRLKCEKLTDDRRRDEGRQVMAKAHIAFGKVSLKSKTLYCFVEMQTIS
jgi:hypothetical protein